MIDNQLKIYIRMIKNGGTLWKINRNNKIEKNNKMLENNYKIRKNNKKIKIENNKI